MPTALIDGIETTYELLGNGPPLLMFSPGGFDATRHKWSSLGVYGRTNMLDDLSRHFRCIVFDRRETGESGGRVQRIAWDDYARQGLGLLDHLGIDRVLLMGGCMGCSPILSFVSTHPLRAKGMVLYWPVGGARYRINAQQRFAQHLAFVQENGLKAVADLARTSAKSFGEDPRLGPWVSPLRRDRAFEAAFLQQNPEHYRLTVLATQRALMDRDTVPGAEPESLLCIDIPTLIVPGNDASHALSAARYLQECIPGAEYWDVPAQEQTAQNAPQRLLEFLDAAPRA